MKIWNRVKKDTKKRMRRPNINLTGVPEGDIRENGQEEDSKKWRVRIFQNCWKTPIFSSRNSIKNPSRIKTEKLTPSYVIMKLPNNKENNFFNIAREKCQRNAAYKGTAVKLTANFSIATFKVSGSEGAASMRIHPVKLPLKLKTK